MITPAGPRPQFKSGQLVRHRRYGYRGVVVSVDLSYQASDEWYHSNQTQPNRNQPWCHVLVHGGKSVTYAAQTSLMEDDAGQPVEHPLVALFFSEYTGQAYVRNERAWPK